MQRNGCSVYLHICEFCGEDFECGQKYQATCGSRCARLKARKLKMGL